MTADPDTTNLSFDDEQLAAALERVVFGNNDVLEAIDTAQRDGSAQVGVFPEQGQAQFQLHPVLSFTDGGAELTVVAFNGDFTPADAGFHPSFIVALHTRAGEVLTSRVRANADGSFPVPVIPLANPATLIGARLELVATA